MRKLKLVLLTLGLFLAAVFGYYLAVVLKARAKTPAIVREALSPDKIDLQLTDLTDHQLDVLLKIQDPHFYHHQGFDLTTPGAGVTSLSQGLVKRFYFDNFKPGIKKIEQTLIARFAFDALTPKDSILKLFINHVYLGQRGGKPIHGLEDASDFYFHKKFKALTENRPVAK